MKKTRIIALLLTLCMLFAITPVFAAEPAVGECGVLTWELDASGTLTVTGAGEMPDYPAGSAPWHDARDSIIRIVIGEGVTSIGASAFSGCSLLTSVSLPSTLASIGASAFSECVSLPELVLPNGLTSVGDNAFYRCISLAAVHFPAGLTVLSRRAFRSCTALTSVILPENLSAIGDSAFEGCTALSYVQLPANLKRIGANAFYGCSSLTGIRFPEGLTSIDSEAFAASALMQVTLPDSLTELGDYALDGCTSMLRIFVSPGNAAFCSEDGVLYSADMKTLICYPPAASAQSFSVPDTVSVLESNAFAYSNLIAVSLPEGLTQIGESAFYACEKLQQLIIPATVTKIGGWAFASSGLNSVFFSGSAPSIASDAFSDVSAAAYYPASDASWNESARQNYGGMLTWQSDTSVTEFTVHIVSASDVEAQLDSSASSIGFARLKTAASEFLSVSDLDLTLVSGDLFHGTLASAFAKGSIAAECSRGLGIDAAAPGIGDWSFGGDRLKFLASSSGTALLAGNVLDSQGLPYFGETSLIRSVTRNGVTLKVGVFGVIDPDTFAMTADSRSGLSAADPVSYASRVASELRLKGCGIVIGLYCGNDPVALAEKTSGVDLWLCDGQGSASMQTVRASDSNSVPVISNGSRLSDVGLLEFKCAAASDGTAASLTFIRNTLTCDKAASYIADPQLEYLTEYFREQEAFIENNVCSNPEISLTDRTAVGRAVSNAYLIASAADAAVELNSALPESLEAGPITWNQLLTDIPSGYDPLYALKITGDTFLSLLETAIDRQLQGGSDVLHFAGVTVTYNPLAQSGKRVQKVVFDNGRNGELLIESAYYTIALRESVISAYPTLSGAKRCGEYGYCVEALAEFLNSSASTLLASVQAEPFIAVEAPGDSEYTTPFEDVDASAYYYSAMRWAVKNGITTGTSATTFSPKALCTRAQVVTFLWRAAGSPKPNAFSNPFTDVDPDAYYYSAVLWALENGITTGTSVRTFSPDDVCTRGQVVTFLWRAAGSPMPSSSENPFSDVKSSDFYHNAVLWAVEHGITNGTGSRTFSPKDSCQRCQVVTFLYRNN